jgi:hypothetical protein
MSSKPVEAGTESVSVDRVLSALAVESRRLVLAYFEANGTETASVDDLVEYVAARGTGRSAPDRVRTRLFHADLPHLDAAGLLTYDRETDAVRYRGPPTGTDADAWSRLVTGAEVA